MTSTELAADLDSAQRMLDEGNIEAARIVLERALSTERWSPDALRMMSFTDMCLRNFDDSLRYGQEAVAVAPTDSRNHRTLSGVYGEMGQFDLAIAHARIADELTPDHPDHLGTLATALVGRGSEDDLREAYGYAIRARDLAPHDASTHNALANVYGQVGDLRAAIHCDLIACHLAPDNPIALQALYLRLLKAGWYASAGRYVAAAHAVTPQDPIVGYAVNEVATFWLRRWARYAGLTTLCCMAIAALAPAAATIAGIALAVAVAAGCAAGIRRMPPVVRAAIVSRIVLRHVDITSIASVACIAICVGTLAVAVPLGHGHVPHLLAVVAVLPIVRSLFPGLLVLDRFVRRWTFRLWLRRR